MNGNTYGLIYIPSKSGGWLHPIKDYERIKWFYEYLKKYSKGFRTRCINDFLDKYELELERSEAYELLNYMRSQVTQKQRDKRKQAQALTELKSQLWEIEFMERREQRKRQDEFLAKMKGEVCLN